jgi:hypothetical protein
MSWSFYPGSHILAQEFLKVLSFGACLGGGLRAEWPVLNAFSAQAMALEPLVGSHDVEASPAGNAVTAAAWGGAGKLLVAAYNGAPEPQEATVEVSAAAWRRAGASLGSAVCSHLLARTAVPSRPGPPGALAAGRLRLPVRLESGEALLWGNWPWEP